MRAKSLRRHRITGKAPSLRGGCLGLARPKVQQARSSGLLQGEGLLLASDSEGLLEVGLGARPLGRLALSDANLAAEPVEFGLDEALVGLLDDGQCFLDANQGFRQRAL